jgi:hypothetical protein
MIPTLFTNWAYVLLFNKALWQDEQEVSLRQQTLELSAKLLALAGNGEDPPGLAHDSCSIASALIIAEHYRRENQLDMAAAWLYCAARTEPHPPLQSVLMISPWIELSSQGDITIPFHMGWQIRRDTLIEAKMSQQENNNATFSSTSEPSRGNRAIFSWNRAFSVANHKTMKLEVNVQEDCALSLETVIDGRNVRYFTYLGESQWREFTLSIEGENLEFLYVLLDDISSTQVPRKCVAHIGPITLLPIWKQLGRKTTYAWRN